MKPLFLSIAGLQSFQEKQSIDFEKIGKDGLFGIFGPTGSGKSTIIDGITLALYGSVVRFENKNSKDKDGFDMEAVNKNCNSAEVNFKFKVGEDVYRAERTYKIGKKSGRLAKTAVLFKIENGEEIKIAENHKEIYQEIKENILGLTLEDFTRSVVLPQGNFSQFLKLDGKNKRDMLERIFNLEKYGDVLSKKTNEYRYNLENQIKKFDIELSAIGFNEDELREKEQILKQYEDDLKKMKDEESEIIKEINELEEINKLEIKLSELNREKIKLDSEKENMNIFEKKISIVEKFIPVIEKLNKKSEYEEKIKNLSEKIREDKIKFDAGKSKADKAKGYYTELEKLEEENQEERSRNIVPQEMILKISDDYKSALRKKELEFKKEKLKKDVENFNELLKKFRNIFEDLNLKKENFEKNLENMKEIPQEKIFEIEKIVIEKSNLLKENENKFIETVSLKDENKNIESKIINFEENLKSLKNDEKTFIADREKYFIHEIRKNLHNGDVCPVCSGKYFDVEGENADKKIFFDSDKFEKIQSDIRETETSIHILKEKRSEIKKKISSLADSIQNIEALKKEIKDLKKEKDLYSKSYEENKTLKSNLEKELKNIISKINEINLKISRYENEISFKENSISEISEELSSIFVENISVEELKKQLEELKEKSEKAKVIDEMLEKIRKDKKRIYEKIEEWNGRIKIFEKELIKNEETYKNLKIDYENLSSEISRIFSENNIKNSDKISEIKNYISELDFMKKKVEDYKNSSISVLRMILDVNSQLKNRIFSKEKYQNLIERCKIVKKSLEKNIQNIGETKKSIEIFYSNKLKAENILKEKEKTELKLNPAKELAKLLEGKKFLEFLSAGKLQSITRTASDTLQKITNGRYRINVDEKSDFSIIDNFNSAVRKPQSLSGGETFMVSLCLALALANQIQLRGKSKLEFFFLDEGFGTLDSELLEIVFGVLENLKSEGMTVGIITHVEEIKNRVARKLMVVPAKIGESGTIVKEI